MRYVAGYRGDRLQIPGCEARRDDLPVPDLVSDDLTQERVRVGQLAANEALEVVRRVGDERFVRPEDTSRAGARGPADLYV